MIKLILLVLLCIPVCEAFNPSRLAKLSPTRHKTHHHVASTDINTPTTQAELSLLLPGNTVRIQIGDVSASRKAWKKRRRNSSPILIPCSILGMSREWMVRWNVMTLLHMVGEESSAGGTWGVGATTGKLCKAYKQRLRGDLKEHATVMGHDSVDSLIQYLFDERIQAEYGISTQESQRGELMLTSTLSRRQARRVSSSAGMVQFRPDADSNNAGDADKMIHTGLAQIRTTTDGNKPRRFTQELLGAAIRVSPYDDALERYHPGDEFNAFVYSYDCAGDNESPLLVLTVDDPRGKSISGTFGASTRVFRRRKFDSSLANDASIERELSDLNVGDGPLKATVVAVSDHSNSVFVDCGVGRVRGKRYGGGMAKVLGMLRFDDMNMVEDSLDIAAGDVIDVYIKSVFNQSGRFMVTTDPSVKDKKAKEWKREKEADKRIERLSSKFETEDIESLVGNEYDGVVKAKSRTGDWYYVQPVEGDDNVSLPVGVAKFSEEEETDIVAYSAGDHVRVRLEGIDGKRGQLALTLLDAAP